MSFSDLGLTPELLRAVSEKSYTEPTPIQARAIPAVLAGRDVLAGAQTGTGKTAAFVLPILQKLGAANGRAPRALVLTPTRELAAQIADNAKVYGKYTNLRAQVIFGGVGINPQIDALRAGCDLLIATPGRLLDLAGQGDVDLRSITTFVLDEADRMLDMGFIRDIRRVLKLLPAQTQRQNLLFSATYSDDIRDLANSLLRDPVQVEVAVRNATADRVDQRVYKVPKDHKRHLLAHLVNDGNWHQVLVFTRTKHGANRLTQQLEGAGIRAAAIHGNKSQGARVRALSDFKDNRIVALVATEVAARGLDIKELPHVVNYELPNVPEDYVHRIGRTARAGATGQAVSLVSPDEAPLLKDIERLLKRQIEVAAVPEFAITQGAAPEAREEQRERRPERSGPRRDGGHRSDQRRSQPQPGRHSQAVSQEQRQQRRDSGQQTDSRRRDQGQGQSPRQGQTPPGADQNQGQGRPSEAALHQQRHDQQYSQGRPDGRTPRRDHVGAGRRDGQRPGPGRSGGGGQGRPGGPGRGPRTGGTGNGGEGQAADSGFRRQRLY